MSEVRISIRGLSETVNRLEGLGEATQAKVARAVSKAAIDIQRIARKNVPAAHGRLRSSIAIRVFDDGLAADIGTDVKYAQYIEFGTGPAVGHRRYMPPPGVLLDWMKRRGIPEEAEDAIRLKIWREGTKPQPFLFPAFEEVRPQLVAAIRKAIMGAS